MCVCDSQSGCPIIHINGVKIYDLPQSAALIFKPGGEHQQLLEFYSAETNKIKVTSVL